jgi:hypothetical protein
VPDQPGSEREDWMRENRLSPEAVKAWCDELRRSRARTEFLRAELPAILAQGGEDIAAGMRADLDLLDLHATLLEAWIIMAGVALNNDNHLNASWQSDGFV